MSQTMGAMGAMGASGAMGAAGAMGAMGATLPESAEWPPLFVDALNKTRGGIVDPLDLTVHVPPPSDLDNAAAMARWAPGVRQHVALFELISALSFETSGRQSTLQHRAPDGTLTDIVTLGLPSKANWTAVWTGQIAKVMSWAELREDRASEILTQLTPQYMFWNAIAHLDLQMRPKTLQLIELALALASFVETRFKHAMACPRPIDFSPEIQPIIPTPAHGSFPSGHATEAFMVAHLLTKLLPHGARLADQLQRLAARTSINRTVAGVHFPVDSAAGQALGQSLGEYFTGACTGPKWKWHARVLLATDVDFVGDTLPPAGSEVVISRPSGYPKSVVRWSWAAAKAEWS